MTVAKAMKLRNELVGEVNLLRNRIQQFNVRRDGDPEPPMKSDALLKELDEKEEQLIDLKVRLEKTTVPVFEKVVRLAEVKGLLQFYQGLQSNSQDRREQEVRWSGGQHETIDVLYTATLKFDVLEDRICRLKDGISELQEELDQFNHSTELLD